jgi:hypothetical protein
MQSLLLHGWRICNLLSCEWTSQSDIQLNGNEGQVISGDTVQICNLSSRSERKPPDSGLNPGGFLVYMKSPDTGRLPGFTWGSRVSSQPCLCLSSFSICPPGRHQGHLMVQSHLAPQPTCLQASVQEGQTKSSLSGRLLGRRLLPSPLGPHP